MALEQLPDVAVQLRPDFTLTSVSSACKKSLEIRIPFMPRIPRNLDPTTVAACFSSALPSLAAKTHAWLMSGGLSCCKHHNRKDDMLSKWKLTNVI